MRVAEHLHLDVPGAPHELLDVDLVVAESRQRLAPGRFHLRPQLVLGLDYAHAAAPAAPACLHHHRIADGRDQGLAGFQLTRQGPGRRQHVDLRGLRRRARGHLVAERPQHLRRGTDEADAGRGAGLGEVRILRKEPVARVDRVDRRGLGDADQVGDVEIRGDRLAARADLVALVSLEAVQREAILVRVDRHGPQPHLRRGPHHADRDLAAIGDHQLADTERHGSPRHGSMPQGNDCRVPTTTRGASRPA